MCQTTNIYKFNESLGFFFGQKRITGLCPVLFAQTLYPPIIQNFKSSVHHCGNLRDNVLRNVFYLYTSSINLHFNAYNYRVPSVFPAGRVWYSIEVRKWHHLTPS